MENRTQNIQVHDTISGEQAVPFGVLQGSVLGPQYISFSPLSNEDTNLAMMHLQACVVAIQNWMIVKTQTKR